MSVNLEVKGSLARILATENLIIEYKKVKTASFNVKTRVLTLPVLKNATNAIYDILSTHEAAHACFSPPDMNWKKERKIPHSYMNIIEDVRIEKLMKRRYPGTPKTFYRGYKELHDRDFFSIGDRDISDFSFPDRINLYFKIGSFITINFSKTEQKIVDKISKVETFDDVLEAAELLYKYCKHEKKKSNSSEFSISDELKENDFDNSDISDDFDNSNDLDESDDSDNSDNFDHSDTSDNSDKSDDFDGFDESVEFDDDMEDIEVETMNSLDEAFKNLVDTSCFDSVYIELPELNLSDIIVSNSEIHSICDSFWSDKNTSLDVVDKEFNQFKQSAKREVNYLVKEFECHKAADSYSRAKTSSTGVLDCNKLHTYKFNDDIFKRTTIISDGKNHGLIFILDWSGSMRRILKDTIKQLFSLVWFCKKVSIPFEVYAFSDRHQRTNCYSYVRKDGMFHVQSNFRLLNFLTSKTNNSDLESQMRNLYRLADSQSGYFSYIPHQFDLHGTPLNESLVALHQILPKFQKEYKLQKVQCVILTDGEATGGDMYDDSSSYNKIGWITNNCYLRDRKSGNTYLFNPYNDNSKITDVLLRNLRDKFFNINFIGIRILESSAVKKFINRYCGYYGELHESTMMSWKKDRAFTINTSAYHSYFGIASNSLSQDYDFEVQESATRTQIKHAFIRSLKSKKMNKKILNEFVQLIK